MMHLQLIIQYTDGHREYDGVERDDPAGRHAMDNKAFEVLARTNVQSVNVIRTDRVVGFARGARR